MANALNISRNKASELIKNGKILASGELLKKAAQNLDENTEISCVSDIFVSRGALKLKSFLENANIDIKGKTALDIGSSTGGFAQILLLNGAKSVVCVDVGTDQLDSTLRADERVMLRENTDIRDFESDDGFEIVTADISFVSLNLILPSIKRLANGDIIMLFKPQFEVGRTAKRDKKGVVKDEKATKLAISSFERECAAFGLVLIKVAQCEIKGKNGNQEIFYHYKVADFNKAEK